MDEDHQQKNDSSIILRTTVPFIEIDSLFIDLSSCIDKPDGGNCDHFSIRGYASQMREKDWKKCCPFDLDGGDETEETLSLLPPFNVPQFRWWRCQNCRKESPAGFEQSSNLDMPDAREAVANASTNLCNLNHPPSFITEKEKKAEGDEVDTRRILNPEIPKETSFVPEIESNLMLEVNKSGLEHRESVENCKLLCGNEVAEVELGLRNLKVIDENPEVFNDEKQIPAHSEQTEVPLLTSGFKAVNQGCIGESDPANAYPAELYESNATASEHTEISVENDTQDHHTDKSGGLHRRKARKVRLLTELLNENENVKTNHLDTEESPSHGTSERSEGLKELSVPQCPVAAKKNIRCPGQNLKSKLPLDEDCLAAETSSSYNVDNKIQALKGDVETTDSFHANESENASIGTGLRTKKSFLSKCRTDMKSIHGKKNKKIQHDACSPLNIPPESGDNMSDISLKHEFSGSAMDPFLLFGSRIEPNSSLSKRKSKTPIIDDRRAFTWSNSMPRSDSVSKEVEIRNDEPVNYSCPSVPDESSGGLHLSLTSYSPTTRNDKKSVFETEVGSRSLLSWQGSISAATVVRNKDIKAKKLKDSNVPFNYSDTFSGQGRHCGVNGKINTGRMHFPNGKHNSNSQVDGDSWSQLQAMDNSGVKEVGKSISVQEHLAAQMKQSEYTVGRISDQRVTDDIPMEIVELMAKNQYERCLDNTRNIKPPSKTSSKKSQIMNFNNAYGRSGSLPEKIIHKWRPQVRNGRNNMHTAADNVGYGKQSSGNYFSHTEGGHFNMDHLHQTLIPPEYATSGHSKSKSSNAVKFLASSTSENACSQYSQYTGGLGDQESSYSRVQSFSGHNAHQPVSQNKAGVAHLWTEALPNHHSYVPTTPKRVASQSTSVNASVNYPESSSKGAMNREHNPKITNLEKDDGNYGLENSSRSRGKHPFSCHFNGTELPRNLMGSLDLYSNETMSAMHLLSLMDAGMQRSETQDIPKFPKKHFSHDLKSKDISRMDIGLPKSFDAINYSSDYYGEIHPLKKSHDGFHPASVGGASISPSIGNESCEIVANLTDKVALQCKQKEITKCSPSTLNRVKKSQKTVFTSASLASNEGVFPIHNLQKKSGGPSSSLGSMSGYHRMENPGRCIIERHGTKRMVDQYLKVSSEFGICSINKNPAEFSIPDVGNVYMIGPEDLQISKRISPEKISGLNIMDGRKRKRNVKHTVVKQHAVRYNM